IRDRNVTGVQTCALPIWSWHEASFNNIGFGMESREQAQQSGKRWFPYNKGGSFRKWYGNQEYVVNWENDGQEIRNFKDENGKVRSAERRVGKGANDRRMS